MLTARFLQLAGDTAVFIALGAIFMSAPAWAYIDPGSGSVVVTTILGLIAAVGYTFRKYFYKIRRKMFGTSGEDDDHDDDR